MRANHIPIQDRLRRRIWKMESKQDDAWVPRKYYPYCKHCNITNVQLSINGDHRRGCPLRGWQKQIDYYKRLLAQALGKP